MLRNKLVSYLVFSRFTPFSSKQTLGYVHDEGMEDNNKICCCFIVHVSAITFNEIRKLATLVFV